MTELSSSFREAWNRFRETESVRLLHETLEWEWTRGRKEYAAFLVEIEDESVRDHIARVIERIRDIPGIDPYPDTYWHVTIKGIGFVVDEPKQPDEVSPDNLAVLSERVRDLVEAAPQFSATVGPPSAFPEVVMLEIDDDDATRALNEQLASSVKGVPVYEVDGPHFLPHISIARFSSHDGLAALKETLADLREAGETGPSFGVREVRLIQAHLAETAPTFDTLARYRLRAVE